MSAEMNTAPLDRSAILPLIDRSTLLVAERAAKLRLKRDASCRRPAAPCRAVQTTMSASCGVRLSLYAGEKTLSRIADGMLGGPPEDAEEQDEAVKEFFNVLCGHIVTEAARAYHTSILFPPPDFPPAETYPPDSAAPCVSFVGGGGEELCIVCE